MRKLGRKTISSLAGKWAKRRTRRLTPGDPVATLRSLLARAKNTRFGKAFRFEEILASPSVYRAFCERVPACDYSDWVDWLGSDGPTQAAGPTPLIDQAWPGKIDIFCLSSGTTTGRTKYIPYSPAMAAVNRKAAFDFFATYLAESPGLAPLLSRTLYLSGSTKLERSETGVIAGDMSGLTKYMAPKLLDPLVLPSREVSSLEPWETRLEALVEVCMANRDIGVISGIPIWQLTLLEAVQAAANKPLAEAIPNLKYLIHGGMSIAPYRERLHELMGSGVQLLEVYAASEAGIAAYQLPGEEGMRFWQCYDVFYEFEDESGKICLADGIEPGRSYRLLISSCSGLWRYRIGDCLVFLQKAPLILSHVSRDKTTSAFDEKVTERELEEAMMAMSSPVADFSLGPDIEKRRHVWFLVGDEAVSDAWLSALDQNLRTGNQDYDDYRGDGRIGSPHAVLVRDRGAFLEFLGREEGGQRKFPRLLTPDEVSSALARFGSPG